MSVTQVNQTLSLVARNLSQAVLTRPPAWRSRYLGHDTGECDASFPLCHLQLNSFKVTETVLQV